MEGSPRQPAPTPPRKRGWPRIRVPTAVVLTILGAALTAWLLPAFTRQWEDRQKARELKADLVIQMSRTTVSSVLDGYYVFRKPTRAEPAKDRWRLNNLQIQAQLRTYFPAKVADDWEAYHDSVEQFIDLAQTEALLVKQYRIGKYCDRPKPGEKACDMGEHNLRPFHEGLIRSLFESIRLPSPPTDEIGKREEQIRRLIHADGSGRDFALAWVAQDLIEMEQSLADEVLAAHPAGFSTSRSDLLHDLLP